VQQSYYEAPELSVVAIVLDILFSSLFGQNSETQLHVYGQLQSESVSKQFVQRNG
jgi:hypothetical protein